MSRGESTPDEAPDLFGEIRSACAEVTRRARHVRVDDGALDAFAAHLSSQRPKPPSLDPTHVPLPNRRDTVAFVLTMNAINFGSGWFPHLKKPEGLSGYRTLAGALRRRFEASGAIRPERLAELSAEDCARLLSQPMESPVDELMAHYAQALRDLGAWLVREHRSRFEGPIEQAGGRASALVAALAQMPLYADVARYQELEVPFYKRAQITCADLAESLAGDRLGHFDDLDELTLFADNLVPHVLRMLGILVYDGLLLARIARGQLLPPGCEEEVEIRAVALTAVELLAQSCARRGFAPGVHRLDAILWTNGQHPRMKAEPRHRTRCTFY